MDLPFSSNVGDWGIRACSAFFSLLDKKRRPYFIRPSLTGRISVERRPCVCPRLVGRTVSSRILQLGTFDQHDARKMPIVFYGWRSKVRVVLSRSRKNFVGRIQNEPKAQGSYNLAQLIPITRGRCLFLFKVKVIVSLRKA